MTREEAIEWLKTMKDTIELYNDLSKSYTFDKFPQAIDMAISALCDLSKKMPNIPDEPSDLISRADAIDAVCGDCTIERKDKCKTDGYCYEVKNLMALPSAEPSIPMFAESAEAYKEWTGEDIGEQVTSKLKNVEISTDNADESTMSQPISKLDLISRADVLEGLKHSTAYLHDDIYTIVNRIPSAETTGALDEAIAKYVADGYMLPPSGDLISRADAIDWVQDVRPQDPMWHYYKHIAVEALENVPSAEPSIPMFAESAEAYKEWTGEDIGEQVTSKLKNVEISTDNADESTMSQPISKLEPSDLISRADALAYPLSFDHYDKENGSREFISGVESYREYIQHLPSVSANSDDRLYIKVYADDEPSVKAEKLYQICGETENRETAKWLKEYFPSADRPIADKCDDCLYEDSDKSLFPCTYCKRNHFDKYEKDESNNITESPNEVVEKNDEVIDHDREWIIGCIKHDGFIKTDRFDKANQIILDALSADTVSREDTVTLNSPISIQADMVSVVRCKDCRYRKKVGTSYYCELDEFNVKDADFCSWGERKGGDTE